MYASPLLCRALLPLVLLVGCTEGPAPTEAPAVVGPSNPCELEVSLFDDVRTLSGTATFRALDTNFFGAYRQTVDCEFASPDVSFVMNILNEPYEGDVPTGEYVTGQSNPSLRPPLIEAYFIDGAAADLPTYVDNPGSITVTESSETRIAGQIDMSILDEDSGNFYDVTGSFVAEPE